MKLAKDCQMLSRRQGVRFTSADLELSLKEVTTRKKSKKFSSQSLLKRNY
jgi:hypothetical protein